MPTRTPALARRSLLVAVAALVVATGVAGCGSDDDADSEAAGTTEPAADNDDGAGGAGTIVAEDFSLTDLSVAPGEEIVLQNDGGATHTATADDGSFDLGEVGGGDTSDPVAAPSEPGAYPFHCEIHSGMTATLTVEG
jgi:plastocyanin